jgi:hypothetical protein
VNCQEASKEELIKSLQVTLREALDFNRQDGIQAAGEDLRKNLSYYKAWRNCCATFGTTAVSSYARALAIHGGTIRVRINAPLSPATLKSTIILLGKYAKTWEFHRSNKSIDRPVKLLVLQAGAAECPLVR